MIIRGIKLSKKGKPQKLTVEMTVDEAGFISTLVGKQSWNSALELWPGYDGEASNIYDELTGGFFNNYWEDGVQGWHSGKAPY